MGPQGLNQILIGFAATIVLFSSQLAFAVTSSITTEARSPRDPWAFSLGYIGTVDQLEANNPSIYNHRLDAGIHYTISSYWNLSSRATFAYASIGKDINFDHNAREMVLNDLSLGANRTVPVATDHTLTLFFGLNLPTSTHSQKEGYHLIGLAGLGHSTHFFGQAFSLGNQLSGYAISQEYYYSPSTNEVNPVGGLSYTLSGSLIITNTWSVGVSAGIKTAQFTDSSNTISYRNAISTTLSVDKFRGSIFYSNGSYADQVESELWFIDRHRQIVGASLSLEF